MNSAKTILITRPREDAQAFAQMVEQKGLTAICAPLLTIEYIENAKLTALSDEDLSLYQALVFTSANGVRGYAQQNNCRNVPVYCVGAQTALQAKEAGFMQVISAEGNVDALSKMLKTRLDRDGDAVLYASAQDIAHELDLGSIEIERFIVYRAVPVDALDQNILRMIDDSAIDAILFFSQRTAESFANLIRSAGRTMAISSIKPLCLSDSVVKSLQDLPWQDVRVAKQPDRSGMLALLDDLL